MSVRYNGQRGAWMADWYDQNGQRRSKSFATKGEAVAHHAAATLDARQRVAAEGDPGQPFSVFAETYLDSVAAKVTPLTLAQLRGRLSDHFIPAIGALPLRNVQAADVRRVGERMLKEGYAPGTVRNALRVAGAVFVLAVERGLVARSPVAGIWRKLLGKRGVPKPPKALDREALKRLLKAARENEDTLLAVALMGLAGLRQGEALALRWRNVEGGRLRVEAGTVAKAGITGPKSAAGVRTIDMQPELAGLLADVRQEREARGPFVLWPADLRSAKKAGVMLRRLSCRITSIARRAEVSPEGGGRTTCHTLRHTFGSLLVQDGCPLPSVARAMGHSDPAFTLRVYGSHLPGSTAGYLGGMLS